MLAGRLLLVARLQLRCRGLSDVQNIAQIVRLHLTINVWEKMLHRLLRQLIDLYRLPDRMIHGNLFLLLDLLLHRRYLLLNKNVLRGRFRKVAVVLTDKHILIEPGGAVVVVRRLVVRLV